jgi:hypothetical protein
VKGVGTPVNQLLDELGDLGTCRPLLTESLDLLVGWNLASEEEPEEGLGQRLGSAGGGREHLLALGDGLAAETDTLIGVKDGSLPDETLSN